MCNKIMLIEINRTKIMMQKQESNLKQETPCSHCGRISYKKTINAVISITKIIFKQNEIRKYTQF